MNAAVAHYREVAYQAVMLRIIADETHPCHQQLLDILDTSIALDHPAAGRHVLTAGGYAGSRGGSRGARPDALPCDLSEGPQQKSTPDDLTRAAGDGRPWPAADTRSTLPHDAPDGRVGQDHAGSSSDGALATTGVVAGVGDPTAHSILHGVDDCHVHGIRRPRNGLMVVPT